MRRWKFVVAAIVAVMFLVPVAAVAATSLFDDVPDDSIFVEDINWMKTSGITNGCNSTGTEYCPEGYVTRQQMAAFMHRLAQSGAVAMSIGTANAESHSDWLATSNPDVKKISATVEATGPGTVTITGGGWFTKTNFTHYCWITWDRKTAPTGGGIVPGTDRAIDKGDNTGYWTCQTNGHLTVSTAGTYEISLLMDLGSSGTGVLSDGSLEALFIPTR